MKFTFSVKLQIVFSLILLKSFSQALIPLNTTNCNVCLTNDKACASQTEYYICQNGTLNTAKVFKCPAQHFCHANKEICIKATTNTTALCPLNNATHCRSCAKINLNNKMTNDSSISFACVGPNHYKICRHNKIFNEHTINCPKDMYCSKHAYEETGRICVPQAVIEAFDYPPTCNEAPNLLFDELGQTCLKYEKRLNILHFNIENPYDQKSESYIRCIRNENVLEGLVIKCDDDGIYNIKKNKCLKRIPIQQIAKVKAEFLQTTTTTTTKKSSGTSRNSHTKLTTKKRSSIRSTNTTPRIFNNGDSKNVDTDDFKHAETYNSKDINYDIIPLI